MQCDWEKFSNFNIAPGLSRPTLTVVDRRASIRYIQKDVMLDHRDRVAQTAKNLEDSNRTAPVVRVRLANMIIIWLGESGRRTIE